MDFFTLLSILIVFAALFGYLNVRFLRLPVTIGLMVIALLFSLVSLGIARYNPSFLEFERELVGRIDFQQVLMEGMLSFLLFAGALHTDFARLRRQLGPILAFATFGVLVSTFLIGTAVYFLLPLLGLPTAYIYCLLFGALISPTDPIAVLGILKQAGAPEPLETKIVGESLFNDGVGVVVFLTIFGIAAGKGGEGAVGAGEIGLLFLEEVGGGVLLGFILGFAAYRLMRRIDNYEVEVMITLALVMGGYSLASFLHFSGPLAMVVAGLFLGNERFRVGAMSERTETYVDKFWELVDVLLNAVLFVLIGLEIVVLTFEGSYVLAGLLCIPIVLLARSASLTLPIVFFRRRLNFVPHTNLIMTWGGLRGGISIALALSLSGSMPREMILVMTYVVVVFSIIVQGLTVGKVVGRLSAPRTVE